MESIVNFLNGFNAQTLLGMGIMLWYFSRDMKKDSHEIREELRQDIKAVSERTDEIARRTEVLSKRTDDLYMMFIKMLEKK